MADAVETPEVVNVEETPKEKEAVTVEEEAVATEKSTTEPEESSNGEQNGSEKNGDVKENGTAKEETNGTAAESGDERKRKSIDVGDSTEVADVTPDKKAKLDEKIEGKQEEVVDSPAEQIAA